MKALGVLESKWDPIRQKLVRRLLEEQDEVLRWGTRGQRGGRDSWQRSGACQVRVTKMHDQVGCKGRVRELG
jgi:hypothetical protein